MKKRLLPLILIFALLMSFALTACGDNGDGASPDSATADESATGDSRAASSAPAVASSSDASSNGDADASSEGSADDPSPDNASSEADAAPRQNVEEQQNDPDDGDSGEQADDPAPAKNDQSSSKKASDSSKSSSSVKPNPAYDDDHRPNFKIVMTDKKSKKAYSAACSYTKDDKDLAYASFFLPGGEYDIAVYEYADEIDKENPLATSSYKNDISEKKKKSIRVFYASDDKKIEVKESTSSRNQ